MRRPTIGPIRRNRHDAMVIEKSDDLALELAFHGAASDISLNEFVRTVPGQPS